MGFRVQAGIVSVSRREEAKRELRPLPGVSKVLTQDWTLWMHWESAGTTWRSLVLSVMFMHLVHLSDELTSLC